MPKDIHAKTLQHLAECDECFDFVVEAFRHISKVKKGKVTKPRIRRKPITRMFTPADFDDVDKWYGRNVKR